MVQFIYICTDETYCFYSLSTYIFKYIQIREGISFLTDSIGSPTSFIFQASGGAAVKTAEERRIKSTQRPQTVKMNDSDGERRRRNERRRLRKGEEEGGTATATRTAILTRRLPRIMLFGQTRIRQRTLKQNYD